LSGSWYIKFDLVVKMPIKQQVSHKSQGLALSIVVAQN